jgi:hypothetical protein
MKGVNGLTNRDIYERYTGLSNMNSRLFNVKWAIHYSQVHDQVYKQLMIYVQMWYCDRPMAGHSDYHTKTRK